MSRNSRAITPETLDKIIRHWADKSLTKEQICERYGVAESTLRNKIKKHMREKTNVHNNA